MPKPEQLGQAALVGWRKKVADVTAPPVAKRGPVSEEQVRAIVGAILFAASAYYVISTIARLVSAARS